MLQGLEHAHFPPEGSVECGQGFRRCHCELFEGPLTRGCSRRSWTVHLPCPSLAGLSRGPVQHLSE
jgi:hypothetical protein